MKHADATDNADWVRGLLETHEQPLVRYALRLTGDLEQARDVVQDVFLRLIAAQRASVDGHAVEWLYTVCRNRCLDVRRKERRMTTLSTEAEQLLTEGAAGAAPCDAGQTLEDRAAVLRLIDSLPERQQEVIRLKFQAGMSYREISGVTNLTVSNVGFLIHTGLRTIRERLTARATHEDRAGFGLAR